MNSRKARLIFFFEGYSKSGSVSPSVEAFSSSESSSAYGSMAGITCLPTEL